jgi:hypothetical protein
MSTAYEAGVTVMIPVKDWIVSLAVQVLAGEAGLGQHAVDLYVLNPQTEWITGKKQDEFSNKIVLVPSKVLPGYSSSFDILVRILKGAGAVGVLYLGGKPTDFSKGTLLLCDNLEFPLLWIGDDVTYSAIIRDFYRRVVEREQQLRTDLEKARHRLENAANDVFSLSTWFDLIERELQVEVELTTSDSPDSQTYWTTRNGERCLCIPLRIGANELSLRLVPVNDCSLYEPESENEWIRLLAGTLQARTEYFLMAEIPGIDNQMHWTLTLESFLFSVLSLLPMMDFRQPVYYNEDTRLPDIVGSLSLLRRIPLLNTDQVSTVSLLWLTYAELPNLTDLHIDLFSLLRVPYPYRLFQMHTIVMRDHILSLLDHPRYQCQSEHVCCIPWRDWEHREGVVVVWFATSEAAQPSEAVVRDLVNQVESRLRKPVRGTFHREQINHHGDRVQFLKAMMSLFDKNYYDFLSVPEGVHGIQFVQKPGEAASLVLLGIERAASLEQALQLIQPILKDKHADELLQALEAYLESGAKIQVAAKRLFLHRNTLRYRLKRVERLLGVDLNDPQIRLSYQLALRAWRLRGHK